MENILKEIDIEIKKIISNESEIDTGKLRELMDMRDRLKGYSITSIARIQGFNNPVTPTFPALGNVAVGNSIFDGLKDIAEIYLKNQTEQLKNKNNILIHDLMLYHRFISELETLTNVNILKTKEELEQLIMKELKTIIEEKKIEEKNIEENKILETTADLNAELVEIIKS